jgi:tetratricopeptide (TPR) repeat protein
MRSWNYCSVLAALLWGQVAAAAGPGSVVGLISQARAEVGATNLVRALELCRQAVRLDPAYGEAWKQQGRILMLLQRAPEAADSFRPAALLRPDDQELSVWRKHLLVDLGRYRELADQMRSQSDAELAAVDHHLMSRMLAALLEANDTATATDLASRRARAATNALDRASAHALVDLMNQKTASAERTLDGLGRPGASTHHVVALAYEQLGVAFMKERDARRAEAAFASALAYHPDRLSTLREWGWSQRQAGQPELAISTWQRGLARSPTALGWAAWVADTQLQLGQAERAEQSLQPLLAAQPDHEQARRLKLAALLMQQHPGAAAYEQEVLVQLNGRRTAVLGHALADRYAGRFAEAAERLEQYRRDAPADDEVKQALLETYAQWAARTPRPANQVPLERMLALDPQHPGALRDLGWIHWSRGDRTRGLELLDHAIENGVNNRDEVIAQVYTALAESGDTTEAAERLKKWAPGTTGQELGKRLFQQGNLLAAEPVLESAWMAWANTQPPRDVGLLLAFTRALKGNCENLTDFFDPRGANQLTLLEPDQLDILVETLTLCTDHPDAFALMQQVEQDLGGRPDFVPEVTAALEAAADRQRLQQNFAQALRLYRRVLARDGDRPSYLRAAECAEALGRRDVAVALMEGVARQSKVEAVRRGAAGKLAEYRNDLSHAARNYQLSLAAAPDHAEVRLALFGVLLRQGRLAEAREQTAWFVQQHEAGARHLRTTLAEMQAALGDDETALRFWQELAAAHPGSAYYAIEQARALYKLGRPDEAETLLQKQIERGGEVRAWQLLAELHAAQGRYADVLTDTERGLEIEVTRDLLRLRAEAAELLQRPVTAQQAAAALLQDDPGNASMARLYTRALMDLGQLDEARRFAESLVGRNPANLHALIALERMATREQRRDEATRWADTMVQQRPWDVEAVRRRSEALAGQRKYGQAMDALRPHLEQKPEPALVALVYHDVISGPYPGRNTGEQIADHIARLAADGYRFLTPDQLSSDQRPPEKSVVLFLEGADARSVARVDEALAAHQARATLAGFTTRDLRGRPGQPQPDERQALLDNGRWFIASSGPLEEARILVDQRGTTGHPLTQRRWDPGTGRRETDDALRRRLEEMLTDMSEPLPAAARVLLYPRGDYGQLALDTDPATLEILHRALSNRFQIAFASDESGFVLPGMNPHYWPVKSVPPGWTAAQLTDHLLQANPLARLHRQREQLLQWSQSPSGNRPWFTMAAAGSVRASDLSAFGEGLSAGPAEHAHVLVHGGGENDNEQRDRYHAGAWAQHPLSGRVVAEALLDYNQWRRDGWNTAEGVRSGAGARWYAAPGLWVDGRLTRMDYLDDHLNDFVGGFLRIRLPQPRWGGDLHLEANRDEVGTVDAIERAIEQWNYVLRATARLGERTEGQLNASYTDRDDVNDTRAVEGRLLWRARQTPHLGLGLYGQIADSWKNPSEYYAPMEVHQYQAMGQWNANRGKLNVQATAQAGYARAQYRDWRFAWGTRVLAEYAIWRRLYMFADLSYQDTVGYQRWHMSGGLGARF